MQNKKQKLLSKNFYWLSLYIYQYHYTNMATSPKFFYYANIQIKRRKYVLPQKY